MSWRSYEKLLDKRKTRTLYKTAGKQLNWTECVYSSVPQSSANLEFV